MLQIFSFLVYFAILMIPTSMLAQERTYDISVSYGSYAAPVDFAFKDSKDYWSSDFTFHLSNRWSVTSGFLAGTFNYYDSLRSNAWDEVTKYSTPATNARGSFGLHFITFSQDKEVSM